MDWRAENSEFVRKSWTRMLPTDDAAIRAASKSAIQFQIEMGCELIVLPVPLIDSLQNLFVEAAQWIDQGIEACKELRVNLPVYATVAITDILLRGTTFSRESIIDTISSHIVTRSELIGAYLVVEQASEDGYCCETFETCEGILLFVDDIVRGGGKRIIVNYAGSFGAVAAAAGAWVFGTGYYRSQRRLRLADFDESEGRTFPRYFSIALMGDVSPDIDIDQINQAGLWKTVRASTEASRLLNQALEMNQSVSSVPTWTYSFSNLAGAIPHYSEVMRAFGKHIGLQSAAERADFMEKILVRASDTALTLQAIAPRLKKTDLSHQAVWLRAFKTWRLRAGL